MVVVVVLVRVDIVPTRNHPPAASRPPRATSTMPRRRVGRRRSGRELTSGSCRLADVSDSWILRSPITRLASRRAKRQERRGRCRRSRRQRCACCGRGRGAGQGSAGRQPSVRRRPASSRRARRSGGWSTHRSTASRAGAKVAAHQTGEAPGGPRELTESGSVDRGNADRFESPKRPRRATPRRLVARRRVHRLTTDPEVGPSADEVPRAQSVGHAERASSPSRFGRVAESVPTRPTSSSVSGAAPSLLAASTAR